MTEPTIRSSVLTGFDGFASRKGLDFGQLLVKAGIDRKLLEDPDQELPLNAVAALLSDAAEACGDPCLGLHWAEALPEGSGGVVGYLLINAKTVRVAVRSIARYISLHLHPVDVRFDEADGIGQLSWRFPPSFTAPRLQYASFAMAVLIIRLRRTAGASWYPIGVDLEHRELGCREEVLRILGPNVRYDYGCNTLHIRQAVLERTSNVADERLFGLIRNLGDRLLKERKASTDIADRTRRAIVEMLEDGEVTLEEVAQRLDLSGRTLQYRLAAVDQTFEAILQDTRRDLADIYLRDTDLPLTEIAFMLGFSELSAFTRAAGKWFGIAPRERRAELRRV